MNIIKFACLSLFFTFLSSNIILSQTSVPFLVESPDARFAGMGEAGTAVADDINATYWNPGGLGFLKKTVIKKNVTSYYFENSNSYVYRPNTIGTKITSLNEVDGIYIKPFGGVLALDFNLVSMENSYQTFEDGRVGKTFTGTDLSIGAAYGRQIGMDFGLGFKLKYIYSGIAPVSSYTSGNNGTGSSVAFDAGVLWNPDFGLGTQYFMDKKFFSAGLTLQNLGPKITYRQESEPLPTTLRLGIALKLLQLPGHKLTIAVDASKLLIKRDSLDSDPLPKSLFTAWGNGAGINLGFGAEYWFERLFAIRSGYFTEPDKAGGRRFLTLGASLRIYFIQGDFSCRVLPAGSSTLSDIYKFTLKVGG